MDIIYQFLDEPIVATFTHTTISFIVYTLWLLMIIIVISYDNNTHVQCTSYSSLLYTRQKYGFHVGRNCHCRIEQIFYLFHSS